MARAKKSCLTLANWTFGSLTSDINTRSENAVMDKKKFWTPAYK